MAVNVLSFYILESLRRSVVKAAAEINLETERAATAEWSESLKVCVEV